MEEAWLPEATMLETPPEDIMTGGRGRDAKVLTGELKKTSRCPSSATT